MEPSFLWGLHFHLILNNVWLWLNLTLPNPLPNPSLRLVRARDPLYIAYGVIKSKQVAG